MAKKNNTPPDFHGRFNALNKSRKSLEDYNKAKELEHEVISTDYSQDFIMWDEPKSDNSLIEVTHPVMVMDLINTKGLVALIGIIVIKNNRWRTNYERIPVRIKNQSL